MDMEVKIIRAIVEINANAEVRVKGDDIDTCEIEWVNGTSEISRTDIKAKMDATAHIIKRADEYPSWQEQLDLLYKDMLADKGDKTGTWFAAVKAVKDKYAKG